ncbi:DUF1641 domain-containing protein [Alicyclobacillus sp.]|uniref:DUF1641 domain-containing protein n=1 Tax=Alicyclobacillus sp. TaxID=61169 RepID=UPI0025C0D06B|nr:DUF1641 domain-containing protein [Alicyclobacillus sp.]MCL6517727.1 DUF1641 domain-containing protein [Alicyclobacillus sp.]
MAKSITVIRHPDERTKAAEEAAARRARLHDIAAEEAAAIEKVFRLWGHMERAGLLDLMNAVFEKGGDVMGILVRQAEKPGTLGLLKNVIALTQGLSEMNPQALRVLVSALSAAGEAMSAETAMDAPDTAPRTVAPGTPETRGTGQPAGVLGGSGAGGMDGAGGTVGVVRDGTTSAGRFNPAGTSLTAGRPLGMWDLLRALRDPDVSAGLALVLGMLRGMGAAVRAEHGKATAEVAGTGMNGRR